MSSLKFVIRPRVYLFALLVNCIFAQIDSVEMVQVKIPLYLMVAPSICTPSCLYEKPGEFHLRNNQNAPFWAKNGGGCVLSFMYDPSLGEQNEASLKIFDSYGATVAEAVPDSNGSIYVENINYIKNAIFNIDIYWNGTYTGSSNDLVHEGTYIAQLQYRLPTSTNPTVLEQSFYVKKPDGAKNNQCGTGYSLAFIPAVGFKFRRSLKKAILKILRRSS